MARLEAHAVALAESVAEISADLEQLRAARPARHLGAIEAPPLVPPPPKSGLQEARELWRNPRRLAKLKW